MYLAAGHKTLVPGLVAELRKAGADDIKVVVGGVIPPNDYGYLNEAGAAAVFGPGTAVVESANNVLNILEQK